MGLVCAATPLLLRQLIRHPDNLPPLLFASVPPPHRLPRLVKILWLQPLVQSPSPRAATEYFCTWPHAIPDATRPNMPNLERDAVSPATPTTNTDVNSPPSEALESREPSILSGTSRATTPITPATVASEAPDGNSEKPDKKPSVATARPPVPTVLRPLEGKKYRTSGDCEVPDQVATCLETKTLLDKVDMCRKYEGQRRRRGYPVSYITCGPRTAAQVHPTL